MQPAAGIYRTWWLVEIAPADGAFVQALRHPWILDSAPCLEAVAVLQGLVSRAVARKEEPHATAFSVERAFDMADRLFVGDPLEQSD